MPYRPSSARRPSSGLVVLLVAGAFAAFGGAAWLAYRAGEPEHNDDRRKAVVETSPAARRPPAEPSGKAEPRGGVLTFDEAFADAEALAARTDDEEPAQTRRALERLDPQKRESFRILSRMLLTDAPDDLVTYMPTLVEHGLDAWVAMASRRMARKDPGFKPVARALWEPAKGARGILAMMNVWGALNYRTRESLAAVAAAARGTFRMDMLGEDARRAVRILQGRE
jgi:hypothetical protein